MSKCKLKNTCTSIISSNCVNYNGIELKSIKSEDILCDLTLTDIIEKLDNVLNIVLLSIDVSNLQECKNSDLQIKDILKIYLDSLFEIKKEIKLIKEKQSNFKIEDIELLLDISCLTNSNLCYNNSTKIIDLFNILINEVCYLKTKI